MQNGKLNQNGERSGLRMGHICVQRLHATLGFSGQAGSLRAMPPQGQDTLLWRGLDFLSWGRGVGHLLSTGELGQQPQAEVFSPLILLPSVDEDFVLRVRDSKGNN